MARKNNATGRSKGKSEHFASMIRNMMETPAWRALSSVAQALYPWLKLEWHGPKFNNNGNIQLSIRQAADRLGVQSDTAARAFHDLQRKGFLVVTQSACLGTKGQGKSTAYELTELKMPNSSKYEGRKLYKNWREGKDYVVHKTMANNPSGRNGRTRPNNILTMRKNKTLSSK